MNKKNLMTIIFIFSFGGCVFGYFFCYFNKVIPLQISFSKKIKLNKINRNQSQEEKERATKPGINQEITSKEKEQEELPWYFSWKWAVIFGLFAMFSPHFAALLLIVLSLIFAYFTKNDQKYFDRFLITLEKNSKIITMGLIWFCLLLLLSLIMKCFSVCCCCDCGGENETINNFINKKRMFKFNFN